MKERVIIAITTCPDAAATMIAESLVGERLAACVQQLAGLGSTYRWQGKVTTDQEAILLIKTTQGRLDALAARIRELHPYELPELVAMDVLGGNDAYLDWIRAETRPAHEA